MIASGTLADVEACLEAYPGIDINACDANNDTPLHLALRIYKYDVAHLLLQQEGIDVLQPAGQLQETPLHQLNGSEEEALQLVDLVLDMAGDERVTLLNTPDINGDTPLHKAAQSYDTFYIARLMQEEAVDVNFQNRKGRTPLIEIASKLGSTEEYIQYVKDTYNALMNNERSSGFNLEARDNNDETALHHAARGGIGYIVIDLIDRGADTGAVNKNGWTPYMVALGGAKNETEMVLEVHAVDEERAFPLKISKRHPCTTPEILAAATIYENPYKHRQKIQDIYEELYSYPEFRPTLDLAAAQAIGVRGETGKEFRIIIADGRNVETLTLYKILGGYNFRSLSFLVGGDMDSHELAGAIIHELTHFAAHGLNSFSQKGKTGSVPFRKKNKKIAAAYHEAINISVLSGHGVTPEEQKAYMLVIIDANERYTDIQLLEEYIARIPQALYLYGEATDYAVPELRNFYRGFNTRLDTLAQQHPNAKYIDNSRIEYAVTAYHPSDPMLPVSMFDKTEMKRLLQRHKINFFSEEKRDFLRAWEAEGLDKHLPDMTIGSSELRNIVLDIKAHKEEAHVLNYDDFKAILAENLRLMDISEEFAHKTVQGIPRHKKRKGKRLEKEVSKALHTGLVKQSRMEEGTSDRGEDVLTESLAEKIVESLTEEGVISHKRCSKHNSIDIVPQKIERAVEEGWQKYILEQARSRSSTSRSSDF